MEIQSAIDLIKYDGLWPTHGSGKSRGYRGDNGSGFFSPSSNYFVRGLGVGHVEWIGRFKSSTGEITYFEKID